MTKRRAQVFDPDIASADIETLRAAIGAFGPASRIENPRIRKMIREVRAWEKGGGATPLELRSLLQEMRDLLAKERR